MEVAGSSGENTGNVVVEFLNIIDAMSTHADLIELRNEFVRMNHPERTDRAFLSSAAFRNLLRIAVKNCRRLPTKVTSHIEEVIDYMKLNAPKTAERREMLLERQRQGSQDRQTSAETLRQLSSELTMVRRKIRKLEAREYSLSDPDAEVHYMRLLRFQKRALDLFKEIQELRGNNLEVACSPEGAIDVQASQYPEINRDMTNFVERQRKRRLAPDFHDVLEQVKRTVEGTNLDITESRQRSEAISVFNEIMAQIKRRRKDETERNMNSLVVEFSTSDDPDPADEDENLGRILDRQRAEYQREIDSVFRRYAKMEADAYSRSHNNDGSTRKRRPKTRADPNGLDARRGDGELSPVEHDSSKKAKPPQDSVRKRTIRKQQLLRVQNARRPGKSSEAADEQSSSSCRKRAEIAAEGSKDAQVAEIIEISSSDSEDENPEEEREPRRVIPHRIIPTQELSEEDDDSQGVDEDIIVLSD